jgi:hypothetical protein
MPHTSARRAAGFRLFLTAPPAECAYLMSGPPPEFSASGFLRVTVAVRAGRLGLGL